MPAQWTLSPLWEMESQELQDKRNTLFPRLVSCMCIHFDEILKLKEKKASFHCRNNYIRKLLSITEWTTLFMKGENYKGFLLLILLGHWISMTLLGATGDLYDTWAGWSRLMSCVNHHKPQLVKVSTIGQTGVTHLHPPKSVMKVMPSKSKSDPNN